MRKLWVIALANLAVVGLVLTAIITNVVSACSSAGGCGSAPPYVFVGLVLVLLGCVGLFLLFRKWRNAAASDDGATDSTAEDVEAAPKLKRSDKARRVAQRDAEAEMESSSRHRLGRIRSQVSDDSAQHDGGAESGDDSQAVAMAEEVDAAAADSSAMTVDSANSLLSENWDDALTMVDDTADTDASADADAYADDAARGADPGALSSAAMDDDNDRQADDAAPETLAFGDEWAVDDVPAISPSNQDAMDFDEAQREQLVTLPMMDALAGDLRYVGHGDGGDRVSFDQIFGEPAATEQHLDAIDSGVVESAVANGSEISSLLPQRFDDCAPVGFPSSVADLRALIAVLSLDILLDKQARDDISAWQAVLSPLADDDSVGAADCEAFAQWIDALAERHNADLAATVANAVQRRDADGHGPVRSAA